MFNVDVSKGEKITDAQIATFKILNEAIAHKQATPYPHFMVATQYIGKIAATEFLQSLEKGFFPHLKDFRFTPKDASSAKLATFKVVVKEEPELEVTTTDHKGFGIQKLWKVFIDKLGMDFKSNLSKFVVFLNVILNGEIEGEFTATEETYEHIDKVADGLQPLMGDVSI